MSVVYVDIFMLNYVPIVSVVPIFIRGLGMAKLNKRYLVSNSREYYLFLYIPTIYLEDITGNATNMQVFFCYFAVLIRAKLPKFMVVFKIQPFSC